MASTARSSLIAALLLGAVLVAPAAQAARDASSQAACLAKSVRKQSGSESGRGEALRAHFECFPDDARRFSQLFEGFGPLADDPESHFTMFFAARHLVSDRDWSAKAVGVLAGAEWSPGTVERFALLMRLSLSARPAGPLDAAARLDDARLESFWRALFGSREGFAPDPVLCKNRGDHRACVVLAAID